MNDQEELPPFRASGASVDNHQGELRLRLYRSGEGGQRTAMTVAIPADVVGGFMASVANHGVHAMDFVARGWKMGDCDECKNVRLVDVVLPSGRKTNAYCPVCNPDGTGSVGTFADFPKVGGLRASFD